MSRRLAADLEKDLPTMNLQGLRFDANPDYGTGALRRRIRLVNRPGAVAAALDDNHHAMHAVLYHDGVRVTDIDAALIRMPTTVCPGAALAIRELAGMRLDTPMAVLYGDDRPRRNCTHLFDLAVLAMAQARRTGEDARVYDAVIPDETTAPAVIELQCNGARLLAWTVSQGTLVAPEKWRGKPMVSGFAAWAVQAMTGETLEAAMVLHKAYFVSRGRRFYVGGATGRPLTENKRMMGVCYAYGPERAEAGTFLGDHVRDFSQRIDAMPLPLVKPKKDQQ